MGRKGKKKPSGGSEETGASGPAPGTSASQGDGPPPQQQAKITKMPEPTQVPTRGEGDASNPSRQQGGRQEGPQGRGAGRGRGRDGQQQRPGQPPRGQYEQQRPGPQERQPGWQQQRPGQAPQGQYEQQRPGPQERQPGWQQQRPGQSPQGQQRPEPQQQSAWPQPRQSQQQIPARQAQPQQQAAQQQQRPQTAPQQPRQQQPRQAADKAATPTKDFSKMNIKEEFASTKQASPVKVSIPDHVAREMIQKIPLRKREGTLGRKIQVFVNMLELKFGGNFRTDVVHYDIAFDPETPRYLLRPAFQKLQQQNFPKRYPAYDGRKNVFSAGLLPFGDTLEKEVVINNEDGRAKTFKITMKRVNEIDLSWLKNVRRGLPEGERDTISITALDTILKQAPYQNLAVTPVGRSFFTPPRGRPVDLGNGLELWVGLFQSAILGWKPYLNVDVAHKGFPKPQRVLDAISEICRLNGPPTRQDIDYRRNDIERYLKKLKVTFMIPNQPETKRTYTINGLVRCARDDVFQFNGNNVSVEHYFMLEKRYKIQFPDVPCLHVGPHQKQIHVPMELCTINAGQATNKKMDETQTSNMIKCAATDTKTRRQKIMDAFNAMRHNESPCLKQEFGLSIGGEFERVNARVLDAPSLTYNEQDREVRVMKGVWRASRFNAAKDLPNDSWTILCLDNRTRENDLRNLEEMLKSGAKGLGMQIGSARRPYGQVPAPTGNLQGIIKFFDEAKRSKLRLVFVVVPDRPPNVYSKVKQVAELNVGVLTQCLKSFTVQRKLNPATVGNILLKVNAKLDGVNHTFNKVSKPKCLFEPCMIVGADVTHPAPDSIGIPSIAAVAASHDPKAFKYNIEIRLQPPKVEIIQHLEEIMVIQLKTFYKKTNGHKPSRIVFYRDGVSEGQFPQVMHHELTAIRNACKILNKDYKPAITFLVVQKRHHIRLFPADTRNSDDRNGNVQAGTIVDTEITHPSHIDFYLVSHASIQGTARPTKYRCLWDDSSMSEDEIEQLTYYLCHMFSRCTRSVSYPTPTYYAHLAAFRARALTQDIQIDLNNLENEQRIKLTIKKDFEDNPMFFV